jgi:hypothetical protein
LGREHVIYKQRWISPRVVVSNYFAISGRDVALSSNQSPVLKFYRSTYTDYEQREEKFSGDLWNVRAMQLWNDWNTQVNAWATRHSIDQKVDSNNDNKDVTVDYMWMRSEDLLPGSPQRLECLHALAKFVGSTLTPEQLCKLSQQVARDYGKSIDFKVLQEPKPPPMDTGERWKQLDRNNKKVRRLVRKASTRRRLQDISATRTALSRFLQDFETWKDLVQSEVRKNVELSKDVVLNVLIDHGNDLRKKWDAYAFDALTVELKVTRVVSSCKRLDCTTTSRKRMRDPGDQIMSQDGMANGKPHWPTTRSLQSIFIRREPKGWNSLDTIQPGKFIINLWIKRQFMIVQMQLLFKDPETPK